MRNPIVGIVAMTSVLSCQGISTEDSESQSNDQPGGSSVYPGCALFDVPVSSATQWRYAVQWKGERHGLEIIRVERVDGTQIELSTTVQLPEENLHWSTTIDCESHRIVAQGRPELAFAVWPFPGVLEGQVVDRPVTDDRRFTIPARHLRGPPRSIALTYRTYTGGSAGRTRVVRVSEQGRITEFDVAPRIGPVEVRFPDGSALELIGAAHAAALEAILAGEDNEGLANNPGLWPIGDPARMSSLTKGRIGTRALTTDDTATPGTRDYSSICSLLDATTYDGHWPEQTFVTKVGTVRDGTVLAGADLTALHDDRSSEFTLWPDYAQFAH